MSGWDWRTASTFRAAGMPKANHSRSRRSIVVEDLGSEIATPDEAREILGLRGGDRVGFRPDRPDRYGRACRDQRTRFPVRAGYGWEAAAKIHSLCHIFLSGSRTASALAAGFVKVLSLSTLTRAYVEQ